MKPLILAVAIALCSASSAQSQDTKPRTPLTLSDAQQEQVKADVKSKLKDPDSARFGTMAASKSAEGVVMVCGWVNAKNSYGGYTGEMPFYGIFVYSTKFILNDIGSDKYDSYAIITVCERRGIRI